GASVLGRLPLPGAQAQLECKRVDARRGYGRSDPQVPEARIQDLATRDAGPAQYRRQEQIRGCALVKYIEPLVVCRRVITGLYKRASDTGEGLAVTSRAGARKLVRLRLCDALELGRSLERREMLALSSLVDQAKQRCPEVGHRARAVREELIAVRARAEPPD